MPAGGFRTFVAGEVLDENDINDYLMQGVLVFAGTATRDSAIGTPVEGQFAFLTDTDTLQYYDGSAWTEYVGGLNWAPVGTVTGAAASGSYTEGDITWQYYKFTGTGSVSFTAAGYADLLVVGGGGGGGFSGEFGAQGGGGGGSVRWGIHEVGATTYTVTVGGGGSSSSTPTQVGGTSSFGSILEAGGGRSPWVRGDATGAGVQYPAHGGGGMSGGMGVGDTAWNIDGGGQGGNVYGANEYDGISLNYEGSSIEYGRGGRSGINAVANTGGGGRNGSFSGAAGVVIVRVQV